MKELKFEKPRTTVEEIADQGSYGKFVISPLERGFGITLGNALRRILLSSLPGAAFVNVKIEGVEHRWGCRRCNHDYPELKTDRFGGG